MSKVTLRIRKFIANKLLDRKQFVVDMLHPGAAAPTRDEIKNQVCQKLNSDKSLCVIFGLTTGFGGGHTTGFGFIYDNVDAMKSVEPLHRLVKAGLETKNKTARRARKTARKNKAKIWGAGIRSQRHKIRRQQRKEELGNQ